MTKVVKVHEDEVAVSSETLRAFVKMHEYKLKAKINDRKAVRMQARLHGALHRDNATKPMDGVGGLML